MSTRTLTHRLDSGLPLGARSRRLRGGIAAALALAAALSSAACTPVETDEPIGEARQAVSDGSGIFAFADGGIWRRGALGPGTGNDWYRSGTFNGITAAAFYNGELYAAAKDNKLWRRGALGPGTGNEWVEVGEAYNVVAMVEYNGSLYAAAKDNKLWKRGALGPNTGNDWSYAGDAIKVVGLAVLDGSLYAAAKDNKLWKRGALGPNTGNDWTYVGDAYSLTGLTAHNGALYAAAWDNKLWKRGALGPNTGNDWTYMGDANGVVSLASSPSACAIGEIRLASGQCVAPPMFDGRGGYHLCSRETGKVVDSDLLAVAWSGAAAQRWNITADGDALFAVQPRSGASFLTADVSSGSPAIPDVTLESASGDRNQKWAIFTADPASSPQPHLDRGYFKLQTLRDGTYVRPNQPSSAVPYDVSRGPANGQELWHLIAAQPSRAESGRFVVLREPDGVPWDHAEVPELTAYDTTFPATTPQKLIGDSPVPYFYVVDGDRAQQVKTSPYYRMSRYGYWTLMFSTHWDASPAPALYEASFTAGYTQETAATVETAMGLTVTGADSLTFGGSSAPLASTFSRDLDTFITQSATTVAPEVIDVELAAPPDVNYGYAGWVWTDRYVLERADGSVVLSWSVADPGVTFERVWQP
ncbi:hypothetical protein [Sorangium sp. So ce128]|uniref:hypothetical protein n=1 Tax=Sorangium sp. So ce128 TaxID=3133281 RepID=UPI003F623282